jgi:hypothetical protein
MPEGPAKLHETLDAKPYEPPKRGIRIVPVLVIAVAAIILLALVKVERHIDHPHPGVRPMLQQLFRACENFRLDNGQYPWPKPNEATPTTVISVRDVYIELRALPGAKINTTLDYLGEVHKDFLKNDTLVDPWGHEIMIRVDPEKGTPVIWSCGKDGKDDTNTGTSPNPIKFPETYYWFGLGNTGDDIVITVPPEPAQDKVGRSDAEKKSEKVPDPVK